LKWLKDGKQKIQKKHHYCNLQKSHKWGKRSCIATWGIISQCKCTCTKQIYFEQVENFVVGRPQKQVAKLLSNKEIKQETEGGKQKIKGELVPTKSMAAHNGCYKKIR